MTEQGEVKLGKLAWGIIHLHEEWRLHMLFLLHMLAFMRLSLKSCSALSVVNELLFLLLYSGRLILKFNSLFFTGDFGVAAQLTRTMSKRNTVNT